VDTGSASEARLQLLRQLLIENKTLTRPK
jgi:hypothetical protein